VFCRRAVELSDALRSLWPNIEVTFNSKVPRRGAFEFVLIKDDGSGMDLERILEVLEYCLIPAWCDFIY
jgi:hypothetical protein